MSKFECRDLGVNASHLEFRSQGRKLAGYAALYGSESHDLGGFTEVISRGAFRSVLESNPDVVLSFNHNLDFILGRTDAGTLRLNEDQRGLQFEADLADTQTIRDLVVSPMQRGELKSMSFAFQVSPQGQSWATGVNGIRKRTITEFSSLHDVAVVAAAAYPSTSVGFRFLSPKDVLREVDETSDYLISLEPYQRRLELAEGKRQRHRGPGDVDPRIDIYRRKLELLSL